MSHVAFHKVDWCARNLLLGLPVSAVIMTVRACNNTAGSLRLRTKGYVLLNLLPAQGSNLEGLERLGVSLE